MSEGTVDFNTITPYLRDVYNRVMIEDAPQTLVYRLHTDKESIPMKNGDGMVWYTYDDYPDVTTPLTDGVYGAARRPVRRTISARTEAYGDYGKYTKKMINTNLEDFTMIQIKKFARQSAKTFDTLMRDTYYTGVSYINATNGVDGTPGTLTEVTSKDFAVAAKMLRSNEAPYVETKMGASTLINTGSVSPAYIAYVHTDLRDDIRNMGPMFRDVKDYGSQKTPYSMELGSVGNVRILETPNGKKVGTTYSIIITADGAAGEVDIAGNGYNTYRHGFGSAGTGDPHSMFMTIGWDGNWAGVIKKDNFCCDLRCISAS